MCSGIPRETTDSLEQLNRTFESGGRVCREAFEALKSTARDCGDQLVAGDLDAAGAILDANWRAEKTFAPAVSNAYLDDIYTRTLKPQNGMVAEERT